MKLLRLVPEGTRIPFTRWHKLFFAFSFLLLVGSGVSLAVQSLNFGIDFVGGVMIEVRSTDGQAVDIPDLRDRLDGLGLGEISLQEFGQPTDVLIRIQRQEGGGEAQQAAVDAVRDRLGDSVQYRRIEVVGPKVGDELVEAGIIAVTVSLLAIMIYIWFRFEWQFGVAAVAALAHDVITTIGIFSLLQLEFNLSTVAAILTIAGYSINDTVVLFDRVRENLRKYKKMPLPEVFNLSVNDTLSRTILTSVTTLLALGALYTFGGEVLRGFTFGMIWGVIIGTYSSICVALSIMLYMKLDRSRAGRRSTDDDDQDVESAAEKPVLEKG